MVERLVVGVRPPRSGICVLAFASARANKEPTTSQGTHTRAQLLCPSLLLLLYGNSAVTYCPVIAELARIAVQFEEATVIIRLVNLYTRLVPPIRRTLKVTHHRFPPILQEYNFIKVIDAIFPIPLCAIAGVKIFISVHPTLAFPRGVIFRG